MKKNILLTSVCNDRYLPGMLILLFSLKKYNPALDLPLKIYHRGDLCAVSMKKIESVYSHVTFEHVTDDLYAQQDSQYMCLLPFKENHVSQVIFIDCDILCLGNMEGLLDVTADFAAVIDYEIRFPQKKLQSVPRLLSALPYFNTGVFSVRGDLLSGDFYQKLRSKVERYAALRTRGKKKLWDQDIINDTLKKTRVQILPFTYNARKNLYKKQQCPIKDKTIFLHYTGGAKPWYTEGSGFLPLQGKYARYQHIHELWHQHHEEFQQKHGYAVF
jgi:lipopolysaccharide biosynthesis glycosyltransferase